MSVLAANYGLHIFSVQTLNEQLKQTLESRYASVWVKGEISELARPASGHLYFALKDNFAKLNCAWFKQDHEQYQFNPATGELIGNIAKTDTAKNLYNGLEVLCSGRISLYSQRGTYQLIVEKLQPLGLGSLALAFEELKKSLAAKGWFNLEHKKPIPLNPKKVALLTSPSGAVVHDFWELSKNRGLSAKIRLYPVNVQGEGSVPQIVRAIQLANSQKWADLIVLIRGGGSLEDLWTFNDVNVVQAIFESELPVLTGIGHEVDYTLADLVADQRAATPSHAARMLFSDQAEFAKSIKQAELALNRALQGKINIAQNQLDNLAKILDFCSPMAKIQQSENQTQNLALHLVNNFKVILAKEGHNILQRENELSQKALQLDNLAKNLTQRAEALLVKHGQALKQLGNTLLAKDLANLDNLATALTLCNPLTPLERGYTLLEDLQGKRITSLTNLQTGQAVNLRLIDGKALATIDAISLEDNTKAINNPEALKGELNE